MSSLKVKMIAPLVIGAALLTCSLSWYTYASARHAMEKAVLMVAKTETDRVKNTMSFFLKSHMATVQNLVSDQHVLQVFGDSDQNARQTTERWLQTLIQGNEFYRDISILNSSGKCVASSNPSLVGTYFTDKVCVQRALEGQFNFADPTMGQVSKQLSLSVAGPISVEGDIAGALQIISDFPGFVNSSAGDSDSSKVFTGILTRDGSFVTHRTDHAMFLGDNFSDLYALFTQQANQGTLLSFPMQGDRHIGFAQVEPASKWIILTSGLASEVFSAAYEVGMVVLGVSILALWMISYFIMRFAQGILDTLFSLIHFAKRVSQGDLSLQLEDTTRTDELAELHLSLQRLVVSLRTMLEQTEEASKLKGQFLANMSHEIRTPINAILGISYLSLRDKEISGKQRSNLDKIQVAAKSLLGVINDILDISKVEAGRLEFDETPFNILDTIENALVIQQINATDKGILLNFRYEEDSPKRFLGDPMRIGQVLNNLLSNAVKFTKQGSITVKCWQTKVPTSSLPKAHEDGSVETRPMAMVHIAVTDTGMGISDETKSILFRPFTQADASITRKFGGTGLGLAISRSIAELMGGDLTVVSQPGEGSTFEFSMRLVVDTSAPQQREDLSQDMDFSKLDLSQKRILIAEDNEINQIILQEMLAPSHASLVTVGNGQLAVDAVRASDFDIALMDMQMPIMDGLQATSAIRKFRTHSQLPIIAVTANAMLEDKNRGQEVGMNAYLTKPIDPAELYRTLKHWLVDKA